MTIAGVQAEPVWIGTAVVAATALLVAYNQLMKALGKSRPVEVTGQPMRVAPEERFAPLDAHVALGREVGQLAANCGKEHRALDERSRESVHKCYLKTEEMVKDLQDRLQGTRDVVIQVKTENETQSRQISQLGEKMDLLLLHSGCDGKKKE